MPSHHPARERAGRYRAAILALAATSLLASLAFVLAPVQRSQAMYSWPASPGDAAAVAIPLMTTRPAQLSATVTCAALRDAAPGTVLLSTTPLEELPGEDPLEALRVTVDEEGLRLRSGGTALPEQQVPSSGACTWEIASTAAATTLRLDGRVVAESEGDHRPAVAGVFSEAESADGLSLQVTADTTFQTSPSPLKAAAAALAVLALAAALLLVGRVERGAPAAARGATQHGATPGAGARDERGAGAPDDGPAAEGSQGGALRWLVDAAVVAVLAVWTVIGPVTVDDGYISGIIHSREANGYVGNVYRWFNAPEAPFGWFYEITTLWSAVSSATTWMRIPSSLLGVATWLLVSRGLLPRLGTFATRGAKVYAAAALTFLAWWLPTNLGLRPEPWTATGIAAVLVLVERGLARGRLLPVLLGAGVAAATLAVTPTGAVALLPFLAAATPLLRLFRASGAGLLASLAAAGAAAATGLLLMFGDQNLAGISLANRIRGELPGALAWSEEAERWYLLLSNADLQGSLSRRVPVLLALAAVVGILWRRRSARAGDVDQPVVDRLLLVAGLSLVVLLFTPTKWTLHFGALVPVGTALVVVGLHLYGRRGMRALTSAATAAPGSIPTGALPVLTVSLVTVLFIGAWSYAGLNRWAYLSDLNIPWNDIPPELAGVRLSTVLLVAALGTAAAGAALAVRARFREAASVRVPGVRLLPSPAAIAVGLMALTVALELASFAKASWERRNTYTLAADAAATVRGESCGLAEQLRVEEDPRAGLLEPSRATGPDGAEPRLDGFTEVADGRTPAGPALTMAGADLPGWAATGHRSTDGSGPAELRTGWFAVPDSMWATDTPLVVTTTGDRGKGTELTAEFGVVSGDEVRAVGAVGLPDPDGASGDRGARDARVAAGDVPADADVVRLVAVDGGVDTDLPLAVSVPRVPVTAPFMDVVDPAAPTLVDWPVAFVFPCQTLPVQKDGVTDVPRWRISPTNDAGDIVIGGLVGGPYRSARSLVDQVEVPVYQVHRPLERPVQLYAWRPRMPTEAPEREIRQVTVPSWSASADVG